MQKNDAFLASPISNFKQLFNKLTDRFWRKQRWIGFWLLLLLTYYYFLGKKWIRQPPLDNLIQKWGSNGYFKASELSVYKKRFNRKLLGYRRLKMPATKKYLNWTENSDAFGSKECLWFFNKMLFSSFYFHENNLEF